MVSEQSDLDHVGVVGRDMDALLAAYRRLGFEPTQPRPILRRDGRSSDAVPLGQSGAHLVFASGYVELAAVHTRSPAHHLAPWLGHGPGLHILALGTEDAQATHSRCEERGLQPLPLARASREIGYGERHGEARFEWFMLPPASTPEGLLCMVRHLTPELVFQPAVQRHPNGASTLAGVYLVTPRPAEVARRLADMAGVRARQAQCSFLVPLRHGWIRCLSAASLEVRFPGTVPVRVPSLAGFTVRVADVDAAERLITARGGRIRRAGDGFWVDPAQAAGSLVEFTG